MYLKPLSCDGIKVLVFNEWFVDGFYDNVSAKHALRRDDVVYLRTSLVAARQGGRSEKLKYVVGSLFIVVKSTEFTCYLRTDCRCPQLITIAAAVHSIVFDGLRSDAAESKASAKIST